jgi:hypothetical protein
MLGHWNLASLRGMLMIFFPGLNINTTVLGAFGVAYV